MNKTHLLALSVAIALTGCGSDSGTTPPTPENFTITAIDGYLQNAQVWVNKNSEAGCETNTDVLTDEKGQASLPDALKAFPICIKAIKDKTIDSSRGVVAENFDLATPAGSAVINPMTNMVVTQMDSDELLTEEEAKQKVIDSLTDGEFELDATLVFGDYHASDVVAETQAQALNLIGESLVDNNKHNIEKQLEITKKVAEKTIEAIQKNDGKLPENFAPVIEVPEGNNPIIVTPNHRPSVKGSIEDKTLDFGDSLSLETASFFEDKDGDELTFSMFEKSGTPNGLTIDGTTGVILGTPEKAGKFDYQIFATDIYGARSYPLDLTVSIETPNSAPVVIEGELQSLQSDVYAWSLEEGQAVTNTLDINDLFDDADGDELTYAVSTTLSQARITGFNAIVTDGIVSFSGQLPRSADKDAETLTITADDGINAKAEAIIKLPAIEKATGILPPVEGPELGFTEAHFNNQNWKMGSFADGDGEIGHSSLMKDGNTLKHCWGSNDDAQVEYKTNISYTNAENVISKLAELDKLTDYVNYTKKDCWEVTLEENGKLSFSVDDETVEYEMLYQHITDDNQYQLLVKIGGDELFWLDSTDTEFAQTLSAQDKVSADKVEYDMTVEGEGAGDDTELFYAAGEYTYTDGYFEYSSILPTGFETPGIWEITQDNDGKDIVKVVEDEEDQKTRYRYIQREFDEFYIGIKWNSGSALEYGLYSYEKQAMLDLLKTNLPIIED
ncbi:putative Ig domain-containing protein [Shewanella sp. 10N.286.48.A6]|uniref:putative Ig domain-containing protein n=1 Tax=Shewanella sp. 10N.286.48.A6 TaxID=1880833 RepID=UPI000C819D1B|nr:putative Ig domain-containing protein [Shewanella sp. 10N.286.48.A6]PMH98989.1 hypothetical protein BCU55_02000 [Shewanella sp. 10N.286.48.A6]